MIRLIIVVEGQTEEAFVNDVLRPHLAARQIYVSATIVGKTIALRRGHRQRGGGAFCHWQADIERILKGDSTPTLRVTTLFDLYGLPGDFPGLETHSKKPDSVKRCEALQAELAALFEDRRFIPYLQRHEFEALVFAALSALRGLFDAKDDLDGFTALETILESATPEEINNGETTAPSKRLAAHLPGYAKTLHGPLALEEAGLAQVRQACPRFDAWLTHLEGLGE